MEYLHVTKEYWYRTRSLGTKIHPSNLHMDVPKPIYAHISININEEN